MNDFTDFSYFIPSYVYCSTHLNKFVFSSSYFKLIDSIFIIIQCSYSKTSIGVDFVYFYSARLYFNA